MFGLMGTCLSKKKPIPRNMFLTVMGLDNAGKTTTIKGLTAPTLDGVVPTVGFAPYEIQVKKHTVKIIDVGGGKKVRDIWKHYYAESHGLVFVVDASKKERLEEAKTELRKVVSDTRNHEKPIVVFANKQDSEEARNEEEISADLELESLVNEFKCPTRVIKCQATTGAGRKQDKGIKTGIEWLVGTIEERWDSINERVTTLVGEQNQAQAKEKEEKKKRVHARRKAREAEEAGEEGGEGDGNTRTARTGSISSPQPRKKSLRGSIDKENEQPSLRSSVTFKSTDDDDQQLPQRITASLNEGRTLTSSSISLGDTRQKARKLSPLPPLITAANGPVLSEDGQKKRRKKKKKPRNNQTSPKYEQEGNEDDMELDDKKQLPPLREDSEETLHETQESFSDFMGVTAKRRGDKSYSFD